MTSNEAEGSSWSEARRQAWFRRHGRQHRIDVVLLGPPSCGKTSVIGALLYAAGMRTKSSFERNLTPIGNAGEVASKVYQTWQSNDKGRLPCAGLQTLQIECKQKLDETALEIGLLDLDAADVDTLDNRPELNQELQDASVLILCVDAAGSERDWYWHHLPRLSAQLAIPTGLFVDRLGGERYRNPEGRTSLQAQRETRGYSRIVVLLTRADMVLEGWCSNLGSERLSRLHLGLQTRSLETMTHQLALRIDVARWIEQLLGGHFTAQVQTLLGGPATKVVVGLTSARGLRPPTADFPEWAPLGVTELLDYLVLDTLKPPFRSIDALDGDRWHEVELRWMDSDLGGGDL